MAPRCPGTGAVQAGGRGEPSSEAPASLGIPTARRGRGRFLLSREAAKFRWKKYIFSNGYISRKELFIHLKYR